MQSERGKRRSSQLLSRLSIAVLVAILVPGAVCSVPAEGLTGILIDRSGNRHELTKIQIRGRSEIEYYVAEQRRLVPLLVLPHLHSERRLPLRLLTLPPTYNRLLPPGGQQCLGQHALLALQHAHQRLRRQ